MHTTIYLAGPLFTTAEREFNEKLAGLLEVIHGISITLPQRRASEILGRGGSLADIYRDCVEQAKTASLIIAILEGSDADSGTCIEMGVAHAQGTPIIGVRSDLRSCEDRGLNLMVSNICTTLIWEPMSSTGALAEKIATAIRAILAGQTT